MDVAYQDPEAGAQHARSNVVVPITDTGKGVTVGSVALARLRKAFTVNNFSTMFLVLEVAVIIFYGTCTMYSSAMSDADYGMFINVSLMMVIGFGYLYTLMGRYAWGGVSWNFMILAVAVQIAPLLNGLWEALHEKNVNDTPVGPIPLSIKSFLRGNFSGATVLISFGALLGRVSPTQLLFMTVFEIICSTANEALVALQLRTIDAGGSMVIHIFGAAFGLAVAAVYGDAALRGPEEHRAQPRTTRHNGTFAMLGTVVLWTMWPSFNAGPLAGDDQFRMAINTFLSIAASCCSTFMVSKAIHGGRRFDMEHIQNATVAGGVVMGSCGVMLPNPWGALLAGFIAGAFSAIGFTYFTPRLRELGLTDMCGILNLHFIPGISGGIAGAIAAAGVTNGNGWTNAQIAVMFPELGSRTAVEQGGFQFAATVISIVFGLATGALAGYLMKAEVFDPKKTSFYEDADDWDMPVDDAEAVSMLHDSASRAALDAYVEERVTARLVALKLIAAPPAAGHA